MQAIDNVIDKLERAKRSGRGYVARCPAHEDRRASLSVHEGDDQRVLVHCHAGCPTEAIVTALGLEMRDLYARGEGGLGIPSRTRATVQPGLTIDGYAGIKHLPSDVLRSFGLQDVTYLGRPAVRIPYADEQGEEICVRFRLAAEGDDRFRWRSGSKPALYGLSRLAHARERGYVVLAEGESDCHTLWSHDFPAIGVPGANNWREDRDAPKLDEIEKIYVIVEPDRGGETVLEWIGRSAIRERVHLVHLVRLEGAKDPSELHLQDPERFAERFQAALDTAEPWTAREQADLQLRRRESWDKASVIATRPDILDHVEQELRACRVVGEGRLARLVYLALTSRLLDQPNSLAIKGPSSGGKSFVLAAVLRFFPESAYYKMTGGSERALIYLEEPFEHRTLVVFEAGGIESDFTSYIVRSLLSEGEIRYPTVEKTPNGLQARTIHRAGPTNLIVTTTAVSLHAENETRLLSITVSDTPEQTAAVMHALASDDRAEPDLETWVAFQAWLETGPRKVSIPFAAALAEAVPPVAVRLRRDFGAVLNLIRAHAVLHQAQRETDTHGRIIATIDDYAAVRELVADLVAEGVEATVPDTVRDTVAAVQTRLAAAPQSPDGAADGISVVAIAYELNLDKSAAWRRVKAAIRRGFLTNLETRRGRQARIVLGDALPDERELLPLPERLSGSGCTVAAVSEGIDRPPSPGGDLDVDAEAERIRAKFPEARV